MDPEVRAMSAMTALAAVNYTTTVLCEVWCPQATLLTQAEEPRSMLEDTPDDLTKPGHKRKRASRRPAGEDSSDSE